MHQTDCISFVLTTEPTFAIGGQYDSGRQSKEEKKWDKKETNKMKTASRENGRDEEEKSYPSLLGLLTFAGLRGTGSLEPT